MDQIRLVVAGVDEAGRSVFVSDEIIPAIMPALMFGGSQINLYGENEVPVVPHMKPRQAPMHYFPPTGGYRFGLFTYPPSSELVVPEDMEKAIRDTAAMGLALEEAVSSPEGFHSTATVDLEYVVDGEFTLYLEDGLSKVMTAGDAVVHCGEKHSWVNESNKSATILVTFIGADSGNSQRGEHAGN